MPKRAGEEARQEIARARQIRWRYLIRNNQFRAEVRELRKAFRDDHEDADSKRQTIIEKWNLAEFPQDILRESVIPDEIPRKLAYYETFLDRPPIGYPVETILPLNSSPRHFLNMKVDLTEPVDLVLYLIVEALREHRPKPKGRRRTDKAEFQLAVFDLQQLGMKFDEIAETLGKRTSTLKGSANSVRSAWLTAYKNVHGQRPISPIQEEVKLHDCEACAVCRVAQRPGDLCALAKRYAELDQQSQRDQMGRGEPSENILDMEKVVTAKWGGKTYVRSSES